MAKNKTNNNDLFSSFNAPHFENKTEQKKEPIVEKKTKQVDVKEPVNEVTKEDIPQKNVEDVTPTTKAIIEQPTHYIDEMAYALPRSGRPKTLDGKYHTYTARIREDLFEYVKIQVGDGSNYQSINDYLNRMIARDMLSK